MTTCGGLEVCSLRVALAPALDAGPRGVLTAVLTRSQGAAGAIHQEPEAMIPYEPDEPDPTLLDLVSWPDEGTVAPFLDPLSYLEAGVTDHVWGLDAIAPLAAESGKRWTGPASPPGAPPLTGPSTPTRIVSLSRVKLRHYRGLAELDARPPSHG